MGTSIDWEGNIGSAPEFKEFANGNKDPRRLLRLNVYFDNSIPKSDGTGFEDRGGFWANVEFWHKDAEHYANVYQKGMRVLIQGRAVMDTWTKDGEDFSALKVQASRVGILPARIEAVQIAQSHPQQAARTQQPQRAQNNNDDAPPDFDDDIPV
ncbi:single-stranded DNA-binding protein [Pseudomonas syringae pv. tomato]|uniref:Single-stranded DNA-binding protein n=23 Tax=Pseudomonas syringae group TaxID=136849 RepID=A0AAW4E4Y6_PSESX|nr:MULTISPECIES: single-stranded DNA-binding protein [Pseudomonas syringae group]EGH27449.1 single-stranded DNA-binding protein [Pseudomonas amygdali pv. mori str. 301020]KPW50173.1 Single-stranded DNA-binding protein [Pseudomonas syringae pv. broussonetiae]RMU70483.1 Single-stranded DNA-binding protein [Pseudomonas syringae pv. aptata]ARA79348.1 single-stranded DNA-binding protein [Pseudomonas amygdali pv. lachrymans]AVI83120.1 single-stranded DNA-binding protein [Pseudomonas syringae pv. tom